MAPEIGKNQLKAVIHVTLKEGVLDPQGQAVRRSLRSLGFSEVKEVRVGKRLEILVAPTPDQPPKERLEEMCRELLANPVIEDFRVEILGE